MDARTLCLGVLSRGDASGYEIKKAFEEGPFSHFHQTSFGSIYPALNALSADGLVAVRAQAQQKRPAKKVYSLTPKGRNALLAALLATPGPDAVRSDLLFILSFAQHLPPARVEQLINARIAWYREMLARMEGCDFTAPNAPGADFVRGMGIAVYRAAADYLARHRDELLTQIGGDGLEVAE